MHIDEIVDVLTPTGLPIRQVPKSVAHSDGLLHACVIAQLINSAGEWTLVKQSASRQDAGQFVSPVGGHVRSGEPIEDALKREALEEMGIMPEKFVFVGSAIFDRQIIGRHENHLFYAYEIFSDLVPVINHESVATQSYSPDKLRDRLRTSPDDFGAAFHFVINSFYPQLL